MGVAGTSSMALGDVSVVVDRTSRVPLYLQVSEQIHRAVSEGALPAGTRLPNELELADDLGVSRPTMRQAIAHLVDQGILVRKRGVGTQVVHAPVRRSLALSSLHDDLRAAGQEPTTVVRDLRLAPASAEAARALDLPPGTKVLRLRRLRHAVGEPLALMTNDLAVPEAVRRRLTREALAARGLYELLRAGGVHLRVAQQTIGARPATAREADLLGEPAGAALLTMSRTAYDDHGRAVEYANHAYRAARYSFSLTLVER